MGLLHVLTWRLACQNLSLRQILDIWKICLWDIVLDQPGIHIFCLFSENYRYLSIYRHQRSTSHCTEIWPCGRRISSSNAHHASSLILYQRMFIFCDPPTLITQILGRFVPPFSAVLSPKNWRNAFPVHCCSTVLKAILWRDVHDRKCSHILREVNDCWVVDSMYVQHSE